VVANSDSPARAANTGTAVLSTHTGQSYKAQLYKILTKDQELTFCSGSTSAYCGTGCQSGYGDCTGSPASTVRSSSSSTRTSSISTRTSSSSARPSSTQEVSTNARCGKDGNGQTCLGSRWGNCCSQYSYWSVTYNPHTIHSRISGTNLLQRKQQRLLRNRLPSRVRKLQRLVVN
jgi:hypothetical protein